MKELLIECIKNDYLSEEFTCQALDIARSQINKKKNIPYEVRRDAISDFSLKLVRKWKLINPEKYPKQYINRMAHTCIIDILRKFNTEHKNKTILIHESKHKTEEFIFNSLPDVKILPHKCSKKERSMIRKFVIRCLKADVPIIEISRNTGIARQTIRKWRHRHKKSGNMFFKEDKRKFNGKK